MAEPCFIKKGSKEPVCGVHNVRLVERQLPDEFTGLGYKGFTYLSCPVSGAALNDEATHQRTPREKDT
jgi:hypothetical protein